MMVRHSHWKLQTIFDFQDVGYQHLRAPKNCVRFTFYVLHANEQILTRLHNFISSRLEVAASLRI
jgi:hypothetical protein